MRRSSMPEPRRRISRGSLRILIAALALLILIPAALRCVHTVEPGHVSVATLYGKIQPRAYEAGLHIPVNPLFDWHVYDARSKTHMETADVPSQDQLATTVDVSVQYRIDGAMAAQILAETGSAEQAVNVHLIPKLRSSLREQGKSIRRAEDFFLEETQQRLQDSLQVELSTFLAPKGIAVEDVLLREIRLPPRLVAQIEEKKEAEQQAERQKARLDQFRTEQEQKIAQAEAERRAAEEEAAMMKVLADARAYEIERVASALVDVPGYIQLEALRTLAAMAKDPAAKLYFLDGDSPTPLPLMHLGDDR